MITQKTIQLKAKSRGFHLVTKEILVQLPDLPQTGLLHLFLQHTSAAITINENASPDVRQDLETVFNDLIREREPYYTHTFEGDDDMPAHVKSSIIGAGITIPITNSALNLGTWQGIFLCEFRNHGGARTLVASIVS